MIHFLPDTEPVAVTPPVDALARVAGLGQALAAAQRLTGSANAAIDHGAIAAAWPKASDAQQALFDTMSAQAVAGSVAGLEAIASLRDSGLDANRAAIDLFTASIRGELDRLGSLLTL